MDMEMVTGRPIANAHDTDGFMDHTRMKHRHCGARARQQNAAMASATLGSLKEGIYEDLSSSAGKGKDAGCGVVRMTVGIHFCLLF